MFGDIVGVRVLIASLATSFIAALGIVIVVTPLVLQEAVPLWLFVTGMVYDGEAISCDMDATNDMATKQYDTAPGDERFGFGVQTDVARSR